MRGQQMLRRSVVISFSPGAVLLAVSIESLTSLRVRSGKGRLARPTVGESAGISSIFKKLGKIWFYIVLTDAASLVNISLDSSRLAIEVVKGGKSVLITT